MSELVYIHKDEKEKPALNFRTLLAQGIASVQQLAGDNWTDYNIHDPGVTILEQVCYALTELGYRANFPFEDLLASQYHPQNTDDTFFSAARILPSNPITINDYRKMLIDRIDGLRNVWIDPLEVARDPSQIRGMYMVFAEASPDTITSPEQIRTLKKDIWDFLTKYGNLSEAFEKVIILERLGITVEADIEISYEADVDEVHARLMYNLSRSMTRPMKFRSLESLMQQDTGINEIFEGPRLYNGFIKDEDLVKKISILTPTTFVTPIKDVPGVAHIRSIRISGNDTDGNAEMTAALAREAPDTLFVDIDKIPVLANKIDDQGIAPIRYYKNNTEVIPDISNVRKIYERLAGKASARDIYVKSRSKINRQKDAEEAANMAPGTYNYRSSSSYDLPVPKGRASDIGSYYSFQNHFPAVYGLGPMGIPAGLRPGRKESILALKGYLMLFDQIMANYFAQLEHFSDLFSLDKDLQQTYFAGIIDNLDKIQEMTVHIKHDLPPALFSRELQNTAARALAAIDDFNERRNRFLDHLLARFGERTASYGLHHFSYYYSGEENRKQQLRIKTDLLASVVKLSKNRARSFNYARPYWGEINSSVMEWKVKILLGLDPANRYLGSQNRELLRYFHHPDPFSFGELFAMMHAGHIEPLEAGLSELSPSYDLEETDPDIIRKLRIDAEMIGSLFRSGDLAVTEKRGSGQPQYLLLFRKEADTENLTGVQKDLMERMLQLFRDIKNSDRRYWIPGRHDNYILEFEQDPDSGIYDRLSDRVWKEIGTFASHEEAFAAGQMLYAHIRNLNLGSEGFYLVDHIHLRPRNNPEKYGIHFSDPEPDISVYSVQHFAFGDIQQGALELLLALKSLEKSPEAIRPLPDKRLGLYLGNTLIAYTGNRFETDEQVIIHRSRLISFFSKLAINDFFNNHMVQAYKPYPEGTCGSDYAFRVSVILPDWTPRFSDPEFRQVLQNIFRMECPAHIGIEFKWLGFGEMMYFESLYAPWLEALRNENENTGALNTASGKLLQFLKGEQNAKDDPAAAYIKELLGKDNCCHCCNGHTNGKTNESCTGCKDRY